MFYSVSNRIAVARPKTDVADDLFVLVLQLCAAVADRASIQIFGVTGDAAIISDRVTVLIRDAQALVGLSTTFAHRFGVAFFAVASLGFFAFARFFVADLAKTTEVIAVTRASHALVAATNLETWAVIIKKTAGDAHLLLLITVGATLGAVTAGQATTGDLTEAAFTTLGAGRATAFGAGSLATSGIADLSVGAGAFGAARDAGQLRAAAHSRGAVAVFETF